MPHDATKLAAVFALTLPLIAAPVLAQDLVDWDEDGDGLLSEEEFNTGFGEDDVYGSWDADANGSLSEEEFNAGIFDRYDADDSGLIEEPELGDLGDDLGEGGLWDG